LIAQVLVSKYADHLPLYRQAHFHGFADTLRVDGYGAYATLARRHQQIRLAFCWAHVRRKFYELAECSPVAADVLRRIASLCIHSAGG
jgi:transposase